MGLKNGKEAAITVATIGTIAAIKSGAVASAATAIGTAVGGAIAPLVLPAAVAGAAAYVMLSCVEKD